MILKELTAIKGELFVFGLIHQLRLSCLFDILFEERIVHRRIKNKLRRKTQSIGIHRV